MARKIAKKISNNKLTFFILIQKPLFHLRHLSNDNILLPLIPYKLFSQLSLYVRGDINSKESISRNISILSLQRGNTSFTKFEK